MGKQRRFEKKVRAAIFYFYFHARMVVFACGVVRASRPTIARPKETDTLPKALSLFCTKGLVTHGANSEGMTARPNTLAAGL
jgi:hypothetical protein